MRAARAARLFFLIQPIRSLFSGVVDRMGGGRVEWEAAACFKNIRLGRNSHESPNNNTRSKMPSCVQNLKFIYWRPVSNFVHVTSQQLCWRFKTSSCFLQEALSYNLGYFFLDFRFKQFLYLRHRRKSQQKVYFSTSLYKNKNSLPIPVAEYKTL